MVFKRDGYTVELSEPTLYVDNESRGRSGHMTHAIVEYAPLTLIQTALQNTSWDIQPLDLWNTDYPLTVGKPFLI